VDFPTSKLRRPLLAILAVLFVLGLEWVVLRGLDEPAIALATVAPDLSGLAPGGAFALLDHQGRAIESSDFRGDFLLLTFGYTHCPDICPTTLDKLAGVLQALAGRGRLKALFVTVDPARDTPAVLADYVAAFDPRIIGLTGDEAAIAGVTRAFRVHRAKAGEGADYLMDHSPTIYLVGPDGGTVTYYPHDASVEQLTEDIARRLDAAG